jgi:hypothetical protein
MTTPQETLDRYQMFFCIVDRVLETPEMTYEQMIKDILKYGYDSAKLRPTDNRDALQSLAAALNSRTAKAEALREEAENE